MKNTILALSILFSALNGMELKKNEFLLEKKADDIAFYPDLNRRIDKNGKVIGTANGHIYWQPDNTVDKNSITLSPNGERLAYCSNDSSGKNMMFSFYNLESDKAEASIKPMEQMGPDSHPSAFFVDNNTVYLSSYCGYPTHFGNAEVADDFPVYTFYDVSTQKFSKVKDKKLLRGFAGINSKSILLATTEKPPYQIYALDPKNKTLKETGITTRATPHVQSTKDGSLIAIGDLKNVKTYQSKNGAYVRVGIWKFSQNHISSFAFDPKNHLTIATTNGDICVCDTELKATLFLMNINSLADNSVKEIGTFSGIITKMRPLNTMIIAQLSDPKTKERMLCVIKGDINQKLEELKKRCKQEIDKRKNACVTL